MNFHFIRVPWNSKTPSGYLMIVCVQYIWAHCGIFSVISKLPLFAGFCSLFEAFVLDINESLEELNSNIVKCRRENIVRNYSKLYQKLTDIASFHSDVKWLNSLISLFINPNEWIFFFSFSIH